MTRTRGFGRIAVGPLDAVVLFMFALVAAMAPTPAYAQPTAAGWFGGQVSITEEAIEGFEDTRFKPGRAVAGSVGFRFGGGFLTEFHFGEFNMRLSENGDDLGRLHVSQVMLGRFGYQARPDRMGVGGHMHVGAGLARITDWDNGPAIARLERQFGARMVVDAADDQFVFEFGGGPDIFLSKYVALTTDLRLLLMNVATEWRAVGRQTVRLDGVDKFFASNFQGQIGIRVFLH
jgi:hypothetical protein